MSDETYEANPITETVPLRALGRRIICRQRKRGVTASGLVIADTAHSSPRLAPWRVVAVGDGCEHVKVGHAICIEAGAPAVFDYGGEKWCFCEERYVQAILSDEASLQSDTTIDKRELSGRRLSSNARYIE